MTDLPIMSDVTLMSNVDLMSAASLLVQSEDIDVALLFIWTRIVFAEFFLF
jgi:hypothetical protein